ncbi:YcbK family protein [Sorangium sp. So ce128]|uniref:YcbK family protein n=1 Tax=Sorangium sp. So ce128 TaxID=3133281 RepID=UPI003F5ECAAF
MLVSIAVPAILAGPVFAEPLPRAHAAAERSGESGEEESEQARRDRAPASPAGAEQAPRTKTRESPPDRRAKSASAATGDEKTSAAGDRRGRARTRREAPHAAADAEENAGGSAKAGGGKKVVAKKKAGGERKKEKRRAARTAESKRRGAKKGVEREAPPKPCHGPVLSMDRSGLEPERLELVDCKGKPREEARRALSLLARPWGTPRPILSDEGAPARRPEAAGRKGRRAGDAPRAAGSRASWVQGGEIAPGVRLLDPGLLSRIDALARRYPGRLVSLVSGYRPQSQGSLHQTGRALDLRIAGVRNDELAAACRALADTGCGYYPNSSFVHVDVRAPGTGSVSWIDASGPGEAPRYVTAWPPPQDEERGATERMPGEDAEEVLRRERRDRSASTAPEKMAGPAPDKASAAPETASAAPETASTTQAKAGASETASTTQAKAGAVTEKTGAVPEKAARGTP